MKKLILFFAILLTSLSLVLAPAKKAEAYCDPACLIQLGGQQIQDIGTRIEGILGAIRQTIMGWLEDAKAWLEKYMQKGWNYLGKDLKTVQVENFKNVPNLTERGIKANNSYDITIDKKVGGTKNEDGTVTPPSVTSVYAGMGEGSIEKRAEAKQAELVSSAGTLESMRYEEEVKTYIAQQEAINAMAKSLATKDIYTELEKLNKEVDELIASLAVAQTPSASGSTAPDDPSKATPRDVNNALKNNLRLRILWDRMLTLQQQVLAMRVKVNAMRGIRELENVAEPVKIEEVKADKAKTE